MPETPQALLPADDPYRSLRPPSYLALQQMPQERFKQMVPNLRRHNVPAADSTLSMHDNEGVMTFLGSVPLASSMATNTEQSDNFLYPDHTAALVDFFHTTTASLPHAAHSLVGAPKLEFMPISRTQGNNSMLYGFVQAIQKIPILGTFGLAKTQDNVLVYARHYFITPPKINLTPLLSAAEAYGIAQAEMLHYAEQASPNKPPSLAILYAGNKPYLVYQVMLNSAAPWGVWSVYVDAQQGGVITMQKKSADSVSGVVTAKVEPSCQGDKLRSVRLPSVEWSQGYATGMAGSFHSEQNIIQALLSFNGAFFRIANYGGNDAKVALPLIVEPADNELAFDDAPLSQVDPFYYANQARLWVRERSSGVPDLLESRLMQWTNEQMLIRVNLPGQCNATYDGQALNFYQAVPAMHCNNSGQAAKVVYHEYGHGIHDHLTANEHTYDHQVAEGVADYVMATITNSSEATGLLGCNNVLKGRSTLRTCNNRYTYCRKRHCDSYPGDEPHNAAPIICGALWELRGEFMKKYGEKQGVRKADEFFLKFLTLVTDMHSSYSAAIAADDDADNNPSNGTLHTCMINRAFLGEPGGFSHFPDLQRQRVACEE